MLTIKPVLSGALVRGWSGRVRNTAPLLVLIALVVAIGFQQPTFLDWQSQRTVINQAIPILLLAGGQMFVILIGGIDLSNAALASLLGVLVAKWLPSMGFAAVFLVVALGMLIGAVNGGICAYAQVPSFVATLGTLALLQALALVISHGSAITVEANYGAVGWLVGGTFGGVAVGFLLGVGLMVAVTIAFVFLRRGRVFHTVGLSERAALMCGIPAPLVRVMAFTLSGLFASLAALYLTASQYSGAPGLADSLLLPAIAATVIGGIAITGGVGNPAGVVLGALIMSVLRVGTTIAGIDPTYQNVIYGIAVIIAVAATTDRRRLAVIK